ncbi:olfactory receptor 52D1-like [Gastrophryne carolinensis]
MKRKDLENVTTRRKNLANITPRRMDLANLTRFHPDFFFLVGIPGLEESHRLLSILFCIMYVVALAGNITLIWVVSANESLHQPMFLFLMVLAIADLLISSITVPKILSIFWLRAHEISFDACLTQMFFIHFTSVVESTILLAMAYDRYVAIYHPLVYVTKLSISFIKMVMGISVLKGIMVITPVVLLAWRLPYWGSNIIKHTYCEHMAMARLATANIRVNVIFGITAAAFSLGVDFILIGFSYAAIIWAILKLSKSEARHKAFNTCGSHLSVISLFFIPAFFSFITHRIPHNHIPPHVHILVANLYVIVPPMMNPIIYGVRTKEIQQRFIKMLKS